MVSHPKIETLWRPKGQPLTPPTPERNMGDDHHSMTTTSTTDASTLNNNHHHHQRQHHHNNRLPRLRNLLSALCFEQPTAAMTPTELPVESPPPPPPPPPRNTGDDVKVPVHDIGVQPQQQQHTPPPATTHHNPMKSITDTFSSSRVSQRNKQTSSCRVLRGSIIETELNASKSGGKYNSSSDDVFYDALEYGNSPTNQDDFLPDTPRESIVLAGVIVTTSTDPYANSPNHNPNDNNDPGRHHSIETVLYNDHNKRNHHHDNDPMNKSVEYTEHEFNTNRSTAVNGISDLVSSAPTISEPQSKINIDHQSNVCTKNESSSSTMILQFPPASPPAPEELPLRFLRAGKNDPVEGIRRYHATLQMRREQKIDTILREPSDQFHIIKEHYPHYCHYRGKNNEPCFYEQPPKTNLRELRKHGVTLDKLLRHYTMVTEYQWQYIERDDLARSIYIIDLDGIRMTDFVGEAVDFVKKAAAFSSQHYPERAGYVFVIHVPGWFKLIWNVIKPIIDEDTLKKIYILRGKEEIRDAMQERIPLEHIPTEYGGTSVPLGQSPQEQTLAEWMQHNNTLTEEGRSVCRDGNNCKFCTWVPARSY